MSKVYTINGGERGSVAWIIKSFQSGNYYRVKGNHLLEFSQNTFFSLKSIIWSERIWKHCSQNAIIMVWNNYKLISTLSSIIIRMFQHFSFTRQIHQNHPFTITAIIRPKWTRLIEQTFKIVKRTTKLKIKTIFLQRSIKV